VRTLSLYKKSFPAGTVSLKAQNSNSAPTYSVIVKATPPSAVPAAPTGLVAVGSDRQVSLAWVASPGALGYTVSRSTSSGSGYIDVATGISTTSFADTGLTNGVPYFFVVRAVNQTGASGNSNQASATPSCVLPAAPAGLQASAGAGLATLSWNAVAGATGYNLKRGSASGSNPPTVASPGSNLFTDAGLNGGTTYFYRVSATNSCGESANSAEVPVTPTAASSQSALLVVNDVDAASSGLQLTPGDALIRSALVGLGYAVTTVEDAASSSTDAAGKKLVVISRSVGSADVASKFDAVAVPVILNEGALFQEMRVCSADAATLGAQTTLTVANPSSPLAAGMSGAVVVVDQPASLTVGAALPSADVALVAAGGASQAAVFGYDTGAALTSGTAPARRVVFFLDDPGNGSTATAQVTSDAGWQLFGAAVSWAAGTTGAVPGAPTSLAASAASGQVDLTWSGSLGATSYRVQRATSSGGPYSVIATVPGASFSDTGVSNGTTFFYVVSAVNSTGESGNSNEAAATPGCTLPAAPGGVGALGASGQVTLTWTAVGNANSYRVKRSTTSGSGYATVASGVTTSAYVNTGLANGTTFFYVVSAVNSCGEGPASGQVSGTPGVAAKIASLTVNDTANASSWAIKSNFQIGDPSPGAHPWPDYGSTYVSAWNSNLNSLLGQPWIQTKSASKNYTGSSSQATITLGATSNVYLVVDDRWGTSPSWLSGWTDTGQNVTIREAGSTNRTFSVWKKANQSGTVGLPRIGSNTAFNYFVIVE
jgi:fibronectin type 3 domain-containing protein